MSVMTHSASWYVDVLADTIISELWVIIYLLHLDCKFKAIKTELNLTENQEIIYNLLSKVESKSISENQKNVTL